MLQRNQVVAAHLDRLVQRARAMLRHFDPATEALGYLLDGGYSQLPGADDNPLLVKIFLDAQYDYLCDRVYLAGALLVGPNGEQAIAHCTGGPPTATSEADLLLTLLGEIVAALPEVAADPQRFPFHLYLFDPFDQRIWLDVLHRHLDALCAIPAFYDLLTSQSGVDEVMFAFLASEIRERRNLGMTCQNLYSVARYKGFKWEDTTHAFELIFRDRVFDNAVKGPGDVWIERRSQFNSHIPLEYAYGAWGQLPARGDPRTTARYRRCTVAALEAFQEARLRAMAHIEDWLNPGHTKLIKEPWDLGAITQAPPLPDLARALEEFLGMEHHAALQQRLALFLLPIERRIQTGRALLLRCLEPPVNGKRQTATFALDYAAAGLLAADMRFGLRIKEGDWMVLNGRERQQPWEIIRGRIAVVKRLEQATITLDLLDMTSYGSQFKYAHETKLMPEVGAFYMLDEMVDDLNADKFLQAVRHTSHNRMYAAIAAPPTADATAPVFSPAAITFLNAIARLGLREQVTATQARVIAGHVTTPLLCVQGPPGTGKTATLGWAVLARIFCAAVRPFRVFVCARTHKATNLILASIAQRWELLRSGRVGKSMDPLVCRKITSGEGEDLPEGVQAALAFHGNMALRGDGAVILGGTPGGLYSLMRSAAGKTVDWEAGIFDLVVIDEASQMSIPEAILATAFLKPVGTILVVGDHRQMPPILAHPWDQERRRAALAYQPALSIFATLLAHRQPVERLDESFRLHIEQARFLAEQIYVHDGLALHSHRTDLLPATPPEGREGAQPEGQANAHGVRPYVAAVLRPEYPIVVVEHDETTSQQFNRVELDLIAPLVSACLEDLGLDGAEGLGIVVPHNAQKAALRQRFPSLDAAGAIDTVERFQGGERDVIIVAATASDPSYIQAEASFLLNLNRLNVAFSRPRKKLIVIASRTLFRFLCGDLEIFDQALLWQKLRYAYATTPLWEGAIAGATVRVSGRHAGHAIARAQRVILPDVAPEDDAASPAYVPQERSVEAW